MRFAEFYLESLNGRESARRAGYNGTNASLDTIASRLLREVKVIDYMQKLRAPEVKAALLSIDEKRQFLANALRTPIGQIGPDSVLCREYTRIEIAGGASRGKLKRGNAPSGNEVNGEAVVQIRVKGLDPLKVIDLDSRLAGHFAADKIELDTGPVTLAAIEEIAKNAALVSPLLMMVMARAGKTAAERK
jgi:hypothetical protein